MSVCDALRLAGGTDMDSPIPLSALLPRCVNHYSGPLSPENWTPEKQFHSVFCGHIIGRDQETENLRSPSF